MKQHFSIIYIFLFILSLCVLLLASFSLFNAHSALETVIADATTAKPETFTELYFDNHLSLPTNVKPGQPYTFSFTIHNLENKDMEYQYEVFMDSNRPKLYMDKDTVTIKKDDSKVITESFTVTKTFSNSEVVVNLINQNQQIDFFIQNPDFQYEKK